MFEALLLNIAENTVQTLFRLSDPQIAADAAQRRAAAEQEEKEDPFAEVARYQYVGAEKEQDRSFAEFDTSRFNLAGQSAEAGRPQQAGTQTAERPKPKPAVKTVRRTEPKVGPNDPCPCGSGKKYKKCHGAAT